MVKLVRTELVKEAGYADVRVEPRLRDLDAAPATSQRRGDVSFVDNSRHVHFHYLTDDVIVHPLSPTFMDHGELTDPLYAMDRAAKKKKELYTQAVAMLRSAGVCQWHAKSHLPTLWVYFPWSVVEGQHQVHQRRCRPAEVSSDCCPGAASEG